MKGCLQEKSGKYYAVFTVSGKKKWVNLQIPTTKGNKRKAELKMAELAVEYAKNKSLFERTDFVELAEMWLKHIKERVDPITFEGYEQYLVKHILPYFKDKKFCVQDVKMADIEDYYKYKAVSGRLDGKTGGLSYNSIRLHAAVLKLIFKFAIINGLINENPCTYAAIPKAREKVHEINFYTAEECEELLKVITGTILSDIVVMTFLYGLRRSEVMGLRWCDVDFENETIRIRHTRVLQKTIVAKDKTKNTSSKRTYPMLVEVKDMLLKRLEQQKEFASIFGNAYNHSGYVFVKEDGTPFYPSYPSHQLAKVIKQHELPHIRFHDLRHSCATYLLSKGWSMKAISEWLGHSEIHTTMNTYTHIDLAKKREMAKTLEDTFRVG